MRESLPEFLIKNDSERFSLIHLDMDVYESTKFVFENLFDKVSKNGIILIDDYNQVKGATKATNEFIKRKKIRISSLSFDKRLHFIVKK